MKHNAKRGTQLPQAKLTEQQVQAIRMRSGYGVPRHRLANEYRVHIRTIDNVCTYATWVHVRSKP